MSTDQRPFHPNGPPAPVLNRADRARRTEALLDAAAVAPTLTERRARLAEVAALNLDLITAITLASAKRYRGTPLDREALLAHVTTVYTESVLAIEPPLERDFVVWATPVVRSAIVGYVRLVPATI